MTAADMMYSVLRQLCDPEYQGPEKPTEQDMLDAVAAYEVEQKMAGAAGNVPQPTTPARSRRIMIPNEAWFIGKLADNWPGGPPDFDRACSAVAAMHCDLVRFIEAENSK